MIDHADKFADASNPGQHCYRRERRGLQCTGVECTGPDRPSALSAPTHPGAGSSSLDPVSKQPFIVRHALGPITKDANLCFKNSQLLPTLAFEFGAMHRAEGPPRNMELEQQKDPCPEM